MSETTIGRLRKSCYAIGILVAAFGLFTLIYVGHGLVGLAANAGAPAGEFATRHEDFNSNSMVTRGGFAYTTSLLPGEMEAAASAGGGVLKTLFLAEATQMLVVHAGIVFVCWLLFRLFFLDLRRSHTPFTRATVRNLRAAGLLIAVLPALALLCEYVPLRLVLPGQSFAWFSAWWLNTTGFWIPVLAGLLLLALAQVFAYGAALQKEVDETL